MSYDKFMTDTVGGTIVRVERGVRREFIAEEHWPKFEKYDKPGQTGSLDQKALRITYVTEGDSYEHSEIQTDPQGYKGFLLSNIKKIIAKSKLSGNPDEWGGCAVKVEYDEDGYPHLAK